MFKTYLKIAARNLTRNKAFSLINIFGLAVGLMTCLLIMLYIFDESNYDRHHKDANNIYRVISKDTKGELWMASSGPLSYAMHKDLPEVTQATRLMTFPDIAKMLLKVDDGINKKQFFETNGYYVDSNFFEVLNYPFIYGSGTKALSEPNSIVLSGAMAVRYFGNSNPIGKNVTVNTPFGGFSYTVTAVFDDSKYKTHIPARYFMSMRNRDMYNWVQQQTSLLGNNVFYTYIKLKEGTDGKNFGIKLNNYFNREAATDMKAMGFTLQLVLQPLKDIHLHSSGPNELGANGNILYVYILGSIALFILVIACINFMNLSTARSEKRAKEVGVRKVMGAQRRSLVFQFLGESFIMCMMALFIALIGVQLILPYFNQFTQKHIHFFDQGYLFFWVIGLTIVTGLSAGLYPALYLSAFKPISILKGKMVNSFSATAFRKVLVVFQFTVSICLVFAVIVIYHQMNFLQQQPLGFDKMQKLILPLQQGYLNSEEKYFALKTELSKIPEIKSITSGSAYPGILNMNDMLFYAEGKSVKDNVDVHINAVEKDYIETLGFGLLSGRSFTKDYNNDSASIILNETAVSKLGYTPQTVVGKKIKFDVGDYHGALLVTGVVKDFNFESLHNTIQPYGFTTKMFSNRFGYLIASVSAKNYAVVISKVNSTWARLNPGVPFEYSFIDQDFEQNYEKEKNMSGLVTGFTLIAIVIAALGLFGLSAFSAEQRTREIGIRKVLGASVKGIAILLSGDFIKLVAIAVLISAPLSWWAMNKWLSDFAYSIHIRWWMFIVSGTIAILIALLTVSFQAIKAAMANPVKSMRTE